MKKQTTKPLGGVNGKVYRLQNTNKPVLSNANNWYNGVYLQKEGKEDFYMFTDKELERAKYRASRNLEDFKEKGWLTDFFD